jgi:hypothetical protein
METPGLAALATARLVALFVVSLVAVSSADLAWSAPSLPRLLARAGTLGFALFLGRLLPEALSAVGAAGLRRRARLIAFLLVPLPGLFALTVAIAAPSLAERVVSALALLQVAVLVLSEALGLELLALWSALLLVLVAALGGGVPGATALCGFLALTGVFFSLDHVVGRLAAWPGVPPPALGLVLRDAARALAAPVFLLGLALALLPPSPAVELHPGGSGGLAAPELRRAYLWLVLVAAAGAGTMALALRWLRGRESDAPPLVEMAESHVVAEEVLEPALEDVRYESRRGRVIRAYLRFLKRAREAGFRPEKHLTPREIEARWGRPEDSLAALTYLFMDARYGPDEPPPEAIRRAEAASRAICASMRSLRFRRRPVGGAG